jgi:hypothetical protein
MHNTLLVAVALGAALSAPAAHAAAGKADGKVTISAPTQGAILDSMEENRVVYSVDPGPRGDHVHVYVDDQEVGILRQLKGSYLLESMPSGQRDICIKVVNKAHVPVGTQECVKVTVK